jgi:prepilin-type N-terminal cleavage/methylation domain-containing protein
VKRILGFTLLEVLVAIAVAAIVISISSSLFSNLISIRASASEQNLSLKYELFLRLLRSDLETTTKNTDGNKNVKINLVNTNEIQIILTKPIVIPDTRMIKLVNVNWKFSDSEVLRQISSDLYPLKIVSTNMKHTLEEINENVFYLSSKIGENYKNLILDTR